MRLLLCTAATALALSIVGCGPKAPDYQSIWTTTPTTTTTSTGQPIPLSEYLESNGIGEQQVAPNTLTDLTVSIPTPPGWAKHESPNIPPATEVITKDGPYPNAMLVVYKLSGDFDPREVAKHANGDVALSENFRQLDASNADFHGFPASMIQYSYDLDGKRLHTFKRTVVATGSAPDHRRYLIQIVVTSLADHAVADAADVEAIISGFTVAAK